ncbi:hypothetical protein PVAND_002008 [Polypedilum vanderplanki]|uniref:DUS-like FMN-binding domain-containing protein n=1 Tax=Polypedilum vanderplanki TaxID=319348 RepID=A0A9J6BPZ8_POLVA|nr:hypothetical protein PVAND_002008 [Polypedilum vanderplanki]
MEEEEKPKVNIKELFRNRKNKKFLNVVAPMVRYSRLEFRSLTRKYGADLCFTPMTIASSFARNENARQVDFSTNYLDSPVIVQFASNNSIEFLYASQMIMKYVDGVDLNAGCPQSWAIADHLGCYLLRKPEIIEDIMKTARRNLPSDFSISCKIRLLKKDNIKATINMVQQLEKLDVSFITIHGRTPHEKSTRTFPVDTNALKEIKKSLHIPVIFNGDINSLEEAEKFYDITKCDGMMSARGILSNPALFANFEKTPISCVQDWIDINHMQQDKLTTQNFHHHLTFMLERILKKPDRIQFNEFTKKQQCLDFLEEKLSLTPKEIDFPKNVKCIYDDSNYHDLINDKEFINSEYSTETSQGKYFISKIYKTRNDNDDYLEFMDDCSSLFE